MNCVAVAMNFEFSAHSSSQYLTEFQRKLLQNRLLQDDLLERYRKRIQIMLLADDGKSQVEICRILGCCPATVRHWVSIAKLGQAHICFESPSGRPKVAHDAYINRLEELVKHSPREYGYAFRRWTAGWLAKHLEKEFNIRISDRHINRLLKQMELSTLPQAFRKTQCTLTESQVNHAAHQDSEIEAHPTRISIGDLQSASDPEPVTPINVRGKQTDLNPLNPESNIYGAASVSDIPFFSNTQFYFWNPYSRHSVANVS
ncbi:MAG: helix-turn-helix domain-containing protein [Leptolyngbya sp. SIO1E4]|nr:helix-turn-helix domain-containing protein [Leptolyngbya sp. SIO1E4]